MKASERTLQQLLHSSDQYVIPAFQRYYSWKGKQWEELFEDIAELLEVGSEERRHFMGSIVAVPDNHQPGSVPAYMVIDGQQRLTTISIVLCAVRDVASKNGWEELSAEIEENYLIHRFKKGRERLKIYPRMRDRGGYIAMLERTGSASAGQVDAAYRFFVASVQDYASDEKSLRVFFTALVTRMDFVAITLDKENPYKIFRSLNSTGEDLTEADLIRNHVFMCLPVDEQDEFDDSLWAKLEAPFTRDGKLAGGEMEAFLRDAIMRDGSYVGKNGTFEAFELRFPAGKFDPRGVVGDLLNVSKLYDIVRGVNHHDNADVEKALRNIRDLNVTTSYPLVVALLEKGARGELEDVGLARSLHGIASFVLRRFVCGSGSRSYGAWFVAACRELDSVLSFLQQKGWPSDSEFKTRFVRFNLYQGKYASVVLAALERSLQAPSEQVLLDGCSIEHVLPQTIDQAEADGRRWSSMLGENWEQLRDEWVHTPGNLTLVGADYNIDMSNRPFDIKQPILAGSKVYLNQHFKSTDLSKWSHVEIEARAKALADLAAVIWPSPEDS